MEAIHKLRISCPYEILRIEDIKISCKPSEHGYLYLKCLVDDTINFKYAIEASTEDKIVLYEELEDKEKSIIFNGIIQNVITTNENGIYYLELEAATSSILLDIEEKTRSFQDAEMSYDNLINEILKDYKGYGFTQCMSRPMSIGKSLFQYKETDYEFLKRVASLLGLEVICDIINLNNLFYYGRPDGKKYTLEDRVNYKACKDLERYSKAQVFGIDFHDTDFFYYEVEKRQKMDIGDKIYFKQKDLYVNQYEAKLHKGDLIYKYRFCRDRGIWIDKIYNKKIKGVALEGKVLETAGEKLKIHLNIDESQDPSKAAWFYYAPPTGNILYSMPLVNESAMLYFQDIIEAAPIATNCVRKNGDTCSDFSDTANRYFADENGNYLDMLPGAINFHRSGFNVNLNDQSGITFNSSGNLSIGASGSVDLSAGSVAINAGSVAINATSKLLVQKSKSSYISLENEFYAEASVVYESGSARDSYGAFTDDEPTAGVAAAIAKKVAESIEFAVGALVSAMAGIAASIGSGIGSTPLMGKSNDISNNGMDNLINILQGKPNSINNMSGQTINNSTSTNDVKDYYIGAGETPGMGPVYKDGDKVKLLAQNGENFTATVSSSESGASLDVDNYEAYKKANYDPNNLIPKTGLYAAADVAQETIWGGLKLVTYVPEEWEAFVDQSGLTYHRPGSWESTRESFDKISSNWHNYLYDKAPYKDLFNTDKFLMNIASAIGGIGGIARSVTNIPKLFSGGLKVAAFANGTLSISKVGDINIAAIAGIGKIGAYGLGTGAVISNMMGDFDNFDSKIGTNKQKGNFGEAAADDNILSNQKVKDAGYDLESIGRDAPSSQDDKIVKGIDGLYKNKNPDSDIEYVIDEAKFGSSKLGNTKDGLQISDDWIKGSDRILKAVDGDEDLARKIAKALDRGKVERVLAKVDSNGNVVTYKLNSSGKVIGIWP
ncbi:hypothetical protein psyc5s11_35240 [Clostridium gelidum]|uniref:Uncharacterized protein n=1 Tax=Clostridium gelidum TaxID=704125 RepID=A0ABN6IZP3_9CLOT|nr:hypothetical protein [Clostridium gelidum]BCZ47457.1 hypothetical protein psyc5s11_35240 [Clostridium gelidum]